MTSQISTVTFRQCTFALTGDADFGIMLDVIVFVMLGLCYVSTRVSRLPNVAVSPSKSILVL